MASPHSLLIAIGAKPKPTAPQPPRSLRDHLTGGSSLGSASPDSSLTTDPASAGGKASQEDAGFIPAGQICGSCQNFTKETGDCSKVEGSPFQAHDTCKNYYEAANGGQASTEAMISGTQPAQSSGAGALRGL